MAILVQGVGVLVTFEMVAYGLRLAGLGAFDGAPAQVLSAAALLVLGSGIALLLLLRARAIASADSRSLSTSVPSRSNRMAEKVTTGSIAKDGWSCQGGQIYWGA